MSRSTASAPILLKTAGVWTGGDNSKIFIRDLCLQAPGNQPPGMHLAIVIQFSDMG